MDTGSPQSLVPLAIAAIWLLILLVYVVNQRYGFGKPANQSRHAGSDYSRVLVQLLPLLALIPILILRPISGATAVMASLAAIIQFAIIWAEHNSRSHELNATRDPSANQEKDNYERQAKQLEMAFNVRDQVNWAIGRETDEDKLFEQICKIVVGVGRFHFAWIGWVREERILPVAVAISPKLSSTPPALADQLNVANRPKGDVFVRGISAATTQADNFCSPESALYPWHGPSLFPEPFSLAILPIRGAHGRSAVLVVATRYVNAVHDRMLAQFDNLGRNIAWAVDTYHNARERERVLHHNRILSRAVEQSAEAICIFGTDGTIRYVNPRFLQLTGYENSQVIGQSPRMLCASEQDALQFDGILRDLQQGVNWRGELFKRKRCGDAFRALETIAPLRNDDGQIISFVSTSEDVTALRHAQAKIEELAYYDTLTGLANRQLLLSRLNEKIEGEKVKGIGQRNGKAALLVLDLDRFKVLNDALGHEAGDRLLCHAADRLAKFVNEGETAARLGGDEFALLIEGSGSREDIARRAESVLEVMRELVEIDGVAFNGSVSIGIAIAPEDAQDANKLLRHADLAMYRAKALGRDSYQFFTEDINRVAMADIGLEHQLKIAVRERQLMPFYQPIWDGGCQVLGFEALARWPLEDGSMISPVSFIPLAEEVGLIEAIGEQMLLQACCDIAGLSRRLGRPFFVAVNLSAMQLRRPESLLQALTRALDESGIEPQCLELELTESMLVQDVDAALAVLHSLRQLGVRLVIDDFGTGYSSLTYLSRFPVDKLKIDKSFVDAIESSRGRMIISAIIALGSRLDMRVVAEGVENQGQRDTLAKLGCDQFQGFWVARPMPFADLTGFVAARAAGSG